jgi:hypothetical protein
MHKKKPLFRKRLFFWNENKNGNLDFGNWKLELRIDLCELVLPN